MSTRERERERERERTRETDRQKERKRERKREERVKRRKEQIKIAGKRGVEGRERGSDREHRIIILTMSSESLSNFFREISG